MPHSLKRLRFPFMTPLPSNPTNNPLEINRLIMILFQVNLMPKGTTRRSGRVGTIMVVGAILSTHEGLR